MSFTKHQEPDDVIGAFNPVYALVQQTGALYNDAVEFRYLFRVKAFSKTGVETIGPLVRKLPNSAGCGAIDISTLLQPYFDVPKPVANSSQTLITSAAASSAVRFELQYGIEYTTTAGGPVTQSLLPAESSKFYAIRGAFSDRFTTTSRNGVQDFRYNSDGTQDGKFLSAGLRVANRLEFSAGLDESGVVSFNGMSGTAPTTNQYTHVRYRITYANGTQGSLLTNFLDAPPSAPTNLGSLAGVINLYCYPQDIVGWSFVSDVNKPTVATDYQFYDISLGTPSLRLSETLRIYNKRQCATKGIRFMFMNRFGGWNILTTTGYTRQSKTYTRDVVNSVRENYFTASGALELTASPDTHGKKMPVTDIAEQYVANTGAISDAEGELVQELLRSPQAYALRFAIDGMSSDSTYYPINITNSRASMVYQSQDKIVQYAIEFEYANSVTPTY